MLHGLFRDTWTAEAKRLAPIRALCLLDGLRLRLQLAAPLRNALPNLRMKCACQYIASPLDRSDEDALGRASTCSMQRTCRPNHLPVWRHSRSPAGDWVSVAARRAAYCISSITKSCFLWPRTLFILRGHGPFVIERPHSARERRCGVCASSRGVSEPH